MNSIQKRFSNRLKFIKKMEGEENILNQKLLEGEENIKQNTHVFPPFFFLTSSLISSFSCALILVICSLTLSQTIFVVIYF
jgi:hypothetical protein